VITGAAAVGAGLLLVGPITAVAQSDDGTTTTTTTTTRPPASTKPATPGAPKDVMTWITNVLDNLVKAGTITQAQEDAITKALQAARPTIEHGPGGRFGGPGGRGGRFGFGIELDAAAKALGITADELRTELQTKTLAQIAADHKIDIQKVIDTLTASAKAKLDDAVKAGKLTQSEADARLKELTDRLNNLVNQKLPTPAKGAGPRGGRPGHHKGDQGDQGNQGTTGSTTTTTTAPGGS
jgi:hypothetical protein